jgi:hypothetical protein
MKANHSKAGAWTTENGTPQLTGFSTDGFSFARWVIGQIVDAGRALWFLIPFDWHPLLKSAVLLIGIVAALRLFRTISGALHYGLSWPPASQLRPCSQPIWPNKRELPAFSFAADSPRCPYKATTRLG